MAMDDAFARGEQNAADNCLGDNERNNDYRQGAK